MAASHAERVLAMLPPNPVFAPFRTWVLAAIGRRSEAAVLLEQLPSTPYGTYGLLAAADACKLVEDRQLRALATSDRWADAMELTLRPLRKAVRVAA